jgi:hypothetical protein
LAAELPLFSKAGAFAVSRKRWSDLFLLMAATALVLCLVLNGYNRVLAVFALILSAAAGTRMRRRMV